MIAKERVSKTADACRFLGATAIFYYHVGIATHSPLSDWGEYAVTCFVILCGVAYTCFSKVRATDLSKYPRYVRNRLMAIFPVFVMINVAIYIASYFYPSTLGRPFTPLEGILSITAISQYFNYRYLSQVMWFVPFIFQTYLLLPFIDRLLDRITPLAVILVAFSVSLLGITTAFFFWHQQAPEICRNWSPVFRLPEVCIGVILGKSLLSKRNRRNAFVAVMAFALLSLALANAPEKRFPDCHYILSLPWHGLAVTAIIFVIALLFSASSVPLMNTLLRVVGTASYPFFLAHGVAIVFVHRYFGRSLEAWLGYFILCWVASILLTLVRQYANDAPRIEAA